MNIHRAILYGENLLQQSGIDAPRWNAERLLMVTLRQDRSNIYTELDRELSAPEITEYETLLQKRAKHFPLAYIEGNQEFYRRQFYVNENVLIPRPETEEIIHAALKLSLPSNPRIADLGAGSGSLALTLALEISQSRVFAIEVSAPAIQVLLKNAGDKVQIIRGDMFTSPCFLESFDLVVSNPPYVEADSWQSLPAETQWEPRLALKTDSLERTYDSLLREASRIVKKGGWFIFEIGFGQADQIQMLIEKHPFQVIEIRQDQQSIPRTFVLQKL